MDEMHCLASLRVSIADVGESSKEGEAKCTSSVIPQAINDIALPVAKEGTELVFLEDSYAFECDGKVLRCTDDEVVLSRTVFHPQGGGQPSDKGTITVDQSVFEVSGVKASSRNSPVIVHAGTWRPCPPSDPNSAKASIDADFRRLCARYHSAGHAIDVAMTRAGRALPATKGYHWPDGGAYVEYDNSVSPISTAGLVEELNRHLADIISSDFATRKSINEETGDRVVEIGGGDGCPCGGTHVESTGELGVVTVTKTKNKSGKLRVSYSLSK